jgi:hypothetical protein
VEIRFDRALRRYRAIGLAGAIALAAGGLTAGALPWGAPFYLTPSTRNGHGLNAAGMVCATAGLTLLIGAWLWIGPLLRHRPRAATLTLACWAAPLALAPPLFSRDVYSYLAQGTMVLRGLNAYAVGPAELGASPLVAQVHPLWLHTPAPYGPAFLALAAGVAAVTGTHLVAGVLGMRLVAVASVVLLAVTVPRLATRYRVDPGRALWLGVLNPLVLIHVVAGAHNDGLMIALLVAGLLLADRGWLAAAVVLVTLAALVKAPAALALGYLAPLWATRLGGRWRWPAALGLTVALAGGTLVAISAGTGLGLGWIDALSTPTVVHNGLSASTDLGQFLGWLGELVKAPLTTATAVTATRLVGGLLATAACVTYWLRRDRLGLAGGVGLSLAVVVLLGPVVHPWYLLWGLVPIAATGTSQRLIRVAVALSASLCLVILPHGVNFTPRGTLEAGLGLLLGLAALVAAGLPTRGAAGGPLLGGPLLGGSVLGGSILGADAGRQPGQVGQGQPVPVDAQPADHSGGHRGDHRVVPELLPRVDVGDVHLDEWGSQQRTGVPQRVGVVGPRARVEHHGGALIGGRVQPAEHLGLGVGLPDGHREP